MTEQKIPARYNRAVIAHLMLQDAASAIAFYTEAFNAVELFRIAHEDGRIVHAEITVEDSVVMLGDAEAPFRDPQETGGTTVGLHVYVGDVDALFAHAVKAGATVLQAVADMFYGDRMGMLRDPFGHVWVLLTHREDLAPAEIKRRGEAFLRGATGHGA